MLPGKSQAALSSRAVPGRVGWTFTLSHAVHQSRRQDTLDGLAKRDRLQTEWNAFLNPFDQRYYEKVREIAESGTGGEEATG